MFVLNLTEFNIQIHGLLPEIFPADQLPVYLQDELQLSPNHSFTLAWGGFVGNALSMPELWQGV